MSPFPIAIVTSEGYLEYINAQFVKVFGYTLEDIPTNEEWARRCFPDEHYRRSVLSLWKPGAEMGSRERIADKQFMVTCKDGRLRHIVFNKQLMHDKKLFILLEDITERKLAEDALIQSQQRFKAIFDQTYQFMGLMDVQGNMLAANKTALDFMQIDEEAVFGKPFWETPWWSHSPREQKLIRDAVREAAGGAFKRFEVTQKSPHGKTLFFDFSIKPVFNDEQQVVLLIPEGRDITERKKADEERLRLSYVVEQANEMVLLLSLIHI